jgi:hypothetical protein
MFIILIAPKSGQPMSLFYRTEATCEIAHKNIYDFQRESIDALILKATDDFGHIVSIARENLSHAVVIDHEKAAQLGPPPGQGQRIPGNGIAGVRSAPVNPDAPLPPVEIIQP